MKRRSNYENRKSAEDSGRWFSFEQVEDVLELIAKEKYPNGDFGDDECALWSLIRNRLGIG